VVDFRLDHALLRCNYLLSEGIDLTSVGFREFAKAVQYSVFPTLNFSDTQGKAVRPE